MKATDCIDAGNGYVAAPEARLSFPNIFSPGKMSGKYEVTLLLPADSDIKGLETLASQTLQDKFGKAVPLDKLKHPVVRRAEDCLTVDGEAKYPDFEGWFVLRATSQRQPGVFDRSNKPIAPATMSDGSLGNPDSIYPGVWARCVINAYAWQHPQSGRGVSFGLDSVMIVRDDDRIGGGGGRGSGVFAQLAEALPAEDSDGFLDDKPPF
jgi:hypothetical protein